MIEKRHATLDRRRHAHLILLHQQLDQVRLDIRVQKAVEQRAVAVRPMKILERRTIGLRARRRESVRRRQQSTLIAEADCGEVVEEHRFRRPVHRQERSPGVPCEAARQSRNDVVRNRRAKRPRNHALVDRATPPVPRGAQVLSVPGEQLVAAFAGQDDGNALPRQRRHEVQRDARGVGDRFVLVPHQFRQRAEEISIVDDDLVGVGVNRARDLARVRELVERPLLERDRERLQRTIDHPRHQRGNRAAVDAARQEHPERHVAHQPEANGFGQQRSELIDDVTLA